MRSSMVGEWGCGFTGDRGFDKLRDSSILMRSMAFSATADFSLRVVVCFGLTQSTSLYLFDIL